MQMSISWAIIYKSGVLFRVSLCLRHWKCYICSCFDSTSGSDNPKNFKMKHLMESCGHHTLELHAQDVWNIRGSMRAAVCLCWPAAWVNPPSACGSSERSQGRMRRLDHGFTRTQRSPESVSRHLLLLCVPHRQVSGELYRPKLWKMRMRHNPPLAYLSICYYVPFNAWQHAVNKTQKWQSLLNIICSVRDGARREGVVKDMLL